ncbi:hypothetical protein [Nostoc sp.]|uniref:hypothetical protein n=1 Tax=Nostoc sp. TaxID=1180 RepID=UPI00359412CE
MTKIIKVDRVKSVTEAKELEELGANFISVSLSKDLRFGDERTIDLDTAISIKKHLKVSNYTGEFLFKDNQNEIIELIKEVGFKYVQFSGYKIPPDDFIDYLKSEEIEIICSGITASHDDDPSWILSHFLEKRELNSVYFQIDLLPEYKNAWKFLKNESPNYPEELQIEDIDQLAQDNKLLITLDYSSHNVLDVISYFANIKGISMILGNSLIEDLHCFDYPEVLGILRKIKFNE